MSLLSHLHLEQGDVSYEALSFYGPTLDAADAEMRQWLLRTLPLGSCVVDIHIAHQMAGMQHRIILCYQAAQQASDRIEPPGLFSAHDFS